MSRKGGWYDEADDYYDEYDDEEEEEEDWDDGFGAYDTGSLAKPKKGSSAAAKPPAGSGAKKPPGPARSGAKPASAMAAKMSADPSEKGVRRPALPGSASRAPGAPPGFPAAPSAGRAAGAFAFDTPSPDDVVLAKRRNDRAGGSDRAAPSDSDVASGAALATLAVSGGGGGGGGGSSSRPVAEFVPHPSDVAAFAAAPRRLHLVVLGHVDAGKSTLMGRLMHASGAVSEKERRANQKDADAAGKASFSWAFALDSRPEERERGVTVDVAQASIETGKTSVTLLDAPGHEDFVPNAISGMARADAAVLVVDAAPGAFEKGFPALGSDAASNRRGGGVGQTREHAELARSLGVRHLIVAVNKMDRCGYDATRFAAIRSALEPFLLGGGGAGDEGAGTTRAGFETIAWVPTSGAEGVNLIRDRSSAESSSSRGSNANAPPIAPLPAALASWYALDRPSLVDAIDAVPSDASDDGKNKPLRLVAFDVSDGSHARGTPASARGGGARALGNAIVGGKIVSGVIRKGQRVAIVPAGVVATVRAIEATGGGAAAKARRGDAFVAGDAVDVGLDGLDGGIDGVVAPGSVLCDPAHPARARVAFEALIDTRATVRVPILAGTRVELFVGGARAEARVAALLELVDPESTDNKVAKTRPRCLTKNQRARVRIEVVGEEKGVCVERAEECDALGRVALRVGGKTVAAGTVTETE